MLETKPYAQTLALWATNETPAHSVIITGRQKGRLQFSFCFSVETSRSKMFSFE